MGPFSASLKVPGDASPLAATLLVENGRLRIQAGDQPIGDWSLQDIDLNRMDTGYRMDAEGEQLLIEVKDQAGFEEAVGENKKGSKRRRFRREKDRPSFENAPAKNAPAKNASAKNKKRSKQPFLARVTTLVDATMERAENKFGSLLPSWVFHRPTALAILLAVPITVFLPTLVSGILLVSGLAIVVFGTLVYTDGRLAAKVLPGRSTPTHVLILGVGVLILGVLLGVVAG